MQTIAVPEQSGKARLHNGFSLTG